jgi:hypothetical protein
VNWSSSKSFETKIRRLTREIRKLDEFFYGTDKDNDHTLYAGMLERKRDDMVRSVVFQLQTVIEDVLSSWIMCRALGIGMEEQGKRARRRSAQAVRRMLWGSGGAGFDMKLNFAVALWLIKGPTVKKLVELNRLWNKCSHSLLLQVPVRRGRRPKQKKQPLLLYRGRDLHSVQALEDFTREYGLLHVKLFSRYVSYALHP